MSGDVQPRKRKDKRKKKGSLDARRIEEYSEESAIFRRQSSTASDDEDYVLQHHGSIGSSDEVIHIHKESKLGGNICSKIVFFGLLGILGVMVGLIIIEYHGSNDMETQSAVDSPWSLMLEGWVDKTDAGHDEHEEQHSPHEDEHEHEGNGHDHHETEYSEGEQQTEDEEQTEEEEDISFVQKTYDELRAAYDQATPEDSDTEAPKEMEAKETEYSALESETEPSETEEEEEEPQEDDPLGQWRSASGPDLLAEEVAETQAQTESEAESSEAEESDDQVPTTTSGAQSVDSQETYEFADITNQADWEIKEELDEADRDLDEGDFSA